MSRKWKFIVFLVAIWAVLFAASYFMSARIEGPRNLDTGFQRLDVLAKYQLLALAVALVSGALGVFWRREGRRIMLIGFVPLLATGVLVIAVVGAMLFFNPRLAPEEAYQPPKTVTEPAQTVAPVPE